MVWKLGILLMIIGVIFLCIFMFKTIKDVALSIKNIRKISISKKTQIDNIMESKSKIAENVEIISERIQKLTSLSLIAGIILGFVKNKNPDLPEERYTLMDRLKEATRRI